jgi:pSer/pThr/pTyr-binding forkhead associated (FHA) protein
MRTSMSIKRLDTGEVFTLERGALSIGRDPNNDIFIDDRDISRQHATIELNDRELVLVDKNSTNGTLLNNWRISRPEALQAGDQIVLADTVLEVCEAAPANEDATSFRTSDDATNFRNPSDTGYRSDGNQEAAQRDIREPEGDDTHFKNPMKTGTPDLSAIPGLNNAAAVFIRHTGRNQIMLYTLEQNSALRWLVGRQRDCDIAIEDNAVSRQHCLIQKRGDRWQIDDQQSRNGTYVNDLAVNMTYLSSGDRVTFGNIDVIFLPLS